MPTPADDEALAITRDAIKRRLLPRHPSMTPEEAALDAEAWMEAIDVYIESKILFALERYRIMILKRDDP